MQAPAKKKSISLIQTNKSSETSDIGHPVKNSIKCAPLTVKVKFEYPLVPNKQTENFIDDGINAMDAGEYLFDGSEAQVADDSRQDS